MSRRSEVVAAVFVGGCIGGYVRFALTQAWHAAGYGIPWSTFAVNVAGAFVLAVVVVLATELRTPRLLRPLIGTGFCGALTTFSSVVVAAARMAAHGHLGTASAYVVLTTAAGLAAAAAGLSATRTVVARW